MLVGFLLHLALFVVPRLRYQCMARWNQELNRFLARMLHISVIIKGDRAMLKTQGALIVANHLGYLDGFVLGSIIPLVYTSKTEVKQWPVFGWIALVGGTIFIDRQRKSKAKGYVAATSQMLKRKVNVLSFPEGTSTNGQGLRQFQSIHFEAPLQASACVVPVVISYATINHKIVNRDNRDALCWYGQVSFVRHLMGVLALQQIEAVVEFLPLIKIPSLSDRELLRKELSASVHARIAQRYPLFS